MLQKTYALENEEEVSSVIQEITSVPEYGSASDKMLIVWAEIWDHERLENFVKKLSVELSETKIICMNHSKAENIINPPGNEGYTVMTFLMFESSGVCIYCEEDEKATEKMTGARIRGAMEGISDVKGIYIVNPRYFFESEDLIKEAIADNIDIRVFGIKPSVDPRYTDLYYDPESKRIIKGKTLAVIFYGRELHINTVYSLGWTPIGKKMTITGLVDPHDISEIDHMPAANVYKKYLGVEYDQITPQNICEFPLVTYDKGSPAAKIGLTFGDTGHLFFATPSHIGEEIQLSYGNPDHIFKRARDACKRQRSFRPEAELLFVCMNRLLLMRDKEKVELECFRKDLNEAAVIYGYAEILHDDNVSGELNSALVSVGFREGEALGESPISEAEINTKEIKATREGANGSIPLEYRLFKFFTAMSEDLIESADEAEKANKAKSDFLSSISHEIRTPINAILGMDEMIIRESREKNTREYAENIAESGKLLLGLINDILDTARIESGKLQIIPVDYELSSTLNDLVNIVDIKARAKGLELEVDVDPMIPHALFGDETRIKQCALNILNNAVKYTEEGSVKLEVRQRVIDKDRISLMFTVKDSGIGIKEEDLEKLYKPFERIDEKRNYNVEGTGLGLSIVNNLLAMMGSYLHVKSEYGKGSEFSFEVEQKVNDPEPIGNYSQTRDKLTEEKERYRESFQAPEADILVVDDTDMNLKVIRSLLKETLVNIDTALDGYSAIEMMRHKKYDIVFLDQQMPELNGVETLHMLREGDSVNADTVCIILTANAVSGAREEYLKEGFDDYVSKPVNGAELEKTIMRHLSREKIMPAGWYENTKSEIDASNFSDRELQEITILKAIKEIDFDEALQNCKNEETLLEVISSFYESNRLLPDLLNKYMKENDAENFTIKVHALKSSARIIGANTIGDAAEKMEGYGAEKNMDAAERELPGLIMLIEQLCTKLELIEDMTDDRKEDDKQPAKTSDIREAMMRIKKQAEDFDNDGALLTIEMLEKYRLGPFSEKVSKVKRLLADFDTDKASILIEDILREI